MLPLTHSMTFYTFSYLPYLPMSEPNQPYTSMNALDLKTSDEISKLVLKFILTPKTRLFYRKIVINDNGFFLINVCDMMTRGYSSTLHIS